MYLSRILGGRSKLVPRRDYTVAGSGNDSHSDGLPALQSVLRYPTAIAGQPYR